MNRLSGLLGSFSVALALLVGCGGNDLVLPGNGTAADLELVDGDNQTGMVGSPLALPLQVKVVDDRGDPLSGHTVAFTLDTDAPGARLDPESARSSRGGIAQSHWTLGASSGTQRVVARVAREGSEPLVVQFSAVVVAGAASKMVRGGGDDQSAEVGHRLADPLVVRVTDAFDNPVAGVSVDWAADEGDVDPASSVTGSDGLAQTSWTLGAATGSQSVTASSGALDGFPVHFTATATNAGGGSSASRLAFQLQPSDTERDKNISPPVEVIVLDQDGERVTEGEFEIMLELTGDDGELKGKRRERTRFGLAIFNDLKVDEEGDYRLRASTNGLPPVESTEFQIHD